MKTYFIKSDDTVNLKTALGRLVEYAYFLEEETGRSYDSFVTQILNEENIDFETQDTSME